MSRGLWSLVLFAACAPQPAKHPREPEPDPSLDAALAAATRSDPAPGSGARRRAALPDRFRARTIGAAPPREPPIGRRGRVTVRLADAELEEALRLLAEAGGFALVADGELSGRVTADLRRVRPWEALVMLAEAHGARVQRRGSVVIVTGR